ncbi:hypothetical protein [Candidatus Avelusimicrobium facis]|uniref:hypothetical protein n=1 Tax=Candidatus Avelusimicrobium facis TaxID=3416203 RepID=UPI003D152A2D
MKNTIRLFVLAVLGLGLAACAGNQTQEEKTQPPYQRKIYLTEQDYLDDLDKQAHAERREAKPNTESDYIFEVQPETQKNVYFFDERTRPMVPGEPSERDYKKTKRLWEKPRRYSPEQYYANQPPAAATDSSSDSSSGSDYDGYDY